MVLFLMGWFVIDAGALFGYLALYAMTPHAFLAGLTGVFLGLAILGIFPRDRDLETQDDVDRCARVLRFATVTTITAMIVPPLIRVPAAASAAVFAAALFAYVCAGAWFSLRGKKLTDTAIDEQIARAENPKAFQLVSARPGRYGKFVRGCVAAFAMLFAAAIVTAGVGRATFGNPPSRYPQFWAALPVRYCIDESNGYLNRATLESAVEKSFDAWGVPASNVGACEHLVEHRDGVSAIGWRELPYTRSGIARTERWVDCRFFCRGHERRALGEADMLLDPTPPDGFGEPCFDAIVLHEVGHFLGLDHLADPSVMGGDCVDELRTLDLQALRERYGDLVQPHASSGTR
jgi:hypothetical protein